MLRLFNETIGWIEPQEEQMDAYQQLYQVHCELHPALKSFFSLGSNVNQAHEEVKY